MAIRAKFVCESVETQGDCEDVTLRAVYSTDDNDPNKSWSQWTPCGELRMSITNPSAQGQLEVGKEYFIDLTPAS